LTARRESVGAAPLKTLALDPGEFVLRSGAAFHWRGRFSSSPGRLYLTSRRLLYTSLPLLALALFAVPWPRESLIISLETVARCGEVELAWPELLRRGIAAPAFYLDAPGQRHYFAVHPGESAEWLGHLRRVVKETA
jgi:hypothetical protein